MNRLREIAKLLAPLLRSEISLAFREKGLTLVIVNPHGYTIAMDWFDTIGDIGSVRILFPPRKAWSRTSLRRDEIWRSASMSDGEIVEIFLREIKEREEIKDLFLATPLSALVDAIEVPVHLPETSIGEK